MHYCRIHCRTTHRQRRQICGIILQLLLQSSLAGMLVCTLVIDRFSNYACQNFGIVCAFGLAFVITYLTFTEYNTKSAGETSTLLFKRGSKVNIEKHTGPSDEEKVATDAGVSEPEKVRNGQEETDIIAPAMSDIFTWQHLSYTIPLSGGGSRKLLDDVSGFVAPGKLTALVGASGAGKTTLLNTLAQRISTGVVTGDRLVNGHSLPSDFQAQTFVVVLLTHFPSLNIDRLY